MSSNRIALIHATPVAVEPIDYAFKIGWPEAETVNLLDDSLSIDRAEQAALTEDMADRIGALASYADSIGSAGILFTCSAFGSAIERAAKNISKPVLKPNEAMFEEALSIGSRVAMVYTFEPAKEGMEQEFFAQAARHPFTATLECKKAVGAMDALRADNEALHNQIVMEAAQQLPSCDVILLAHFSTSRALESVRETTDVPVLASPDSAVRKLRRMLTGRADTADSDV